MRNQMKSARWHLNHLDENITFFYAKCEEEYRLDSAKLIIAHMHKHNATYFEIKEMLLTYCVFMKDDVGSFFRKHNFKF